MTDNEKRAHDLTLLYMYGQIQNGQIEISCNDDFSDYVLCYENQYYDILKHVSEIKFQI